MSDQSLENGRVELQAVDHLHRLSEWVTEGDTLRTNDRKNWLTVTGSHERLREKSHRPDCRDTIELSGNGTQYHILQWEPEGDFGPMLYKEADWEETPDSLNPYTYPRSGDRVDRIELGTRYAQSPVTAEWYRLYSWEDRGDGQLVANEKEPVDRSEVPIAWLDDVCFEYDGRLKRWGEIEQALGLTAYRDDIEGLSTKETDDLEIGGVTRVVVGFKTEQAVEKALSRLKEQADTAKDAGCFSEAEDITDFAVALRRWNRNEADFQ